jgi:hypothetical protein
MPEPRPASRLDITASDAHVYDVTITHPTGAETTHCVTVPDALLRELGLAEAQEPLLVRASLEYLMEHSPAAIPDRFDLDEIGKAIPEYREEIPGRV